MKHTDKQDSERVEQSKTEQGLSGSLGLTMSSTAGAAPSVLQTARRADRQFGTFVWQQLWIQTNPMLPPKISALFLELSLVPDRSTEGFHTSSVD